MREGGTLRESYFSLGCILGYCSSIATSSFCAPITGTHFASSDATSTACMNRRPLLRPSNARKCRNLRFESKGFSSDVALRCLLRVSRLIHPSSSLSLSLSNATRSAPGDGFAAAACPAAPPALGLRFRCNRLSSDDDGYGEWLLCRKEKGLGDGRVPDADAAADDRDDKPVEACPGRGLGFDLFSAGPVRSTATFSIRILGGSTLNLFPLPPRRGMAANKNGKKRHLSTGRDLWSPCLASCRRLFVADIGTLYTILYEY